MKQSEALELVKEIESLSENFGWPDDQALKKLNRAIFSLRANGPSLIQEKLSSIEQWAKIGFSTRRFENHGGSDRVRSFVLQDCSSLKGLIRRSWDANA